jgi:trehalose 6-phosphate phosphatase
VTTPVLSVLSELSDRIADSSHVLLGMDFDGTLAPFMTNREDVVLSPEARRALLALSLCRKATVAIISGRELGDLQERVRIPNVIYCGNHGLEISGRGMSFTEPAATSYQAELQALGVDLAGKLKQIPGAALEDKGLTLTVHYRGVPADAHEDVGRIVQAVLTTADYPFVLTLGDKVFEIRPRADWNKGSALQWIKERLGKADPLVIYIGDDTTDEDVFVEMPDAVTVKVAESPDTAARYHIENPTEVRRFLHWLTEQLSSRDEDAISNGPKSY